MADTVLIIEDDDSILKGLQHNLRLEGYDVITARDGEEGLRTLRANPPDLVLLDIMLPRLDGLKLLQELRSSDPDMPVLVLSAKGQEADKVLGLSLGADDYITKPFGLAELLARIRALGRRRRRLLDPLVTFGDVTVDLRARRVNCAGREVEMTAREFEVLRHFVTRPEEVLTRQQLMRAAWGAGHHGTTRTVDNFVARLRAKLEKDPETPRYLTTVRGVGYRFDPRGVAPSSGRSHS